MISHQIVLNEMGWGKRRGSHDAHIAQNFEETNMIGNEGGDALAFKFIFAPVWSKIFAVVVCCLIIVMLLIIDFIAETQQDERAPEPDGPLVSRALPSLQWLV